MNNKVLRNIPHMCEKSALHVPRTYCLGTMLQGEGDMCILSIHSHIKVALAYFLNQGN